jgi:hypothetical protein
MSGCVSVTALSFWSAFVAMTSILALVVIERRKPARPRDEPGRVPLLQAATKRFDVVEIPTRRYRLTPILRQIWAIGGLGISTVVLGALLALALAGAIVAMMLALSGLAK